MAAFVEREGEFEVAVFFEEGGARGGFGDEETGKEKTVGRQAARAEDGGDGAGTGDGDDGETAATAGTDETETGVADGGRAGVAHEGDGFSGGELRGDVLGGFGFVVIVIGNQFAAEAEAREQSAGGAGVFTGDEIDGAENRARAVGEIGEVADGGRDDVEMTGLRGERGVGGGFGHEAGIKKSGARPDFARANWTRCSASRGLAHAGDLTFPTGGTAPRYGGLAGSVGRATAQQQRTESQHEQRKERFFECGHD